MSRTRILALVATAALAASPAAAQAAPKAKSHTIKSGTTTLTLDPTATTNLASMGITMSGTAPAATAGPVLTFPIKPGSRIKAKGAKTIVSGKIIHLGALQMAHDPLSVALTDPTVAFGAAPVLTGVFAGLKVDVATLKYSASRVKVTGKSMKITGVEARLTELAASAMNGTFGVTGFKANDLVGTATLSATFKK